MCRIILALKEVVSKCHQRCIPAVETQGQLLAIVMAGKRFENTWTRALTLPVFIA